MIFFQYLLIILVAAPVIFLALYLFLKIDQIINKLNRRDQRLEELRKEARYTQLRDSDEDSVRSIHRKADKR